MAVFWVLVIVVVVASAAIIWGAYALSDEGAVNAFLATIGCAFFGGIFLFLTFFGSFYNEHTETCNVTSKDRGGDNGSYRVYTSDCGTLENTDAWFRGKFDSADVWQQIPDQGTVTVRVVGARVPFASWFPNVLEVVGGYSSE